VALPEGHALGLHQDRASLPLRATFRRDICCEPPPWANARCCLYRVFRCRLQPARAGSAANDTVLPLVAAGIGISIVPASL
jgi:hypothetical protein